MAACGMRAAMATRAGVAHRGVARLARRPALCVRAVAPGPNKDGRRGDEDANKGEPLLTKLGNAVGGAGAAALTAAAAAFLGLLPVGVAAALSDSFATYSETGFDMDLDIPFDGVAQPETLEVMFLVVATYLGLMVIYVWLASLIDEEPGAGGASSASDPPHGRFHGGPPAARRGQGQQGSGGSSSSGGAGGGDEREQLPPGYAQYLHAPIRSTREPKRPHELVAPGGAGGAADCSLDSVKASLAAQAAEYVSQQVKECRSVVRRKLYLRRLAAQDAARLGAAPPAARGAAGIAGSGGIALLLGQPGQMEAWVDQCLDNMTPDLLDPSCEDILVNSVSAVAARRLAAAEAGELVRSMQAANKQRNKELASSHGQEIWW